MRLFLLTVGMVMAVMANSWAGCSDRAAEGSQCGYEWDAAKRYPDEAKLFGAGTATFVCTRNGVQVGALSYTPVVRGVAGVCYFWVRDMDAKVEPGRYPTRDVYMQRANGSCPRQDDAGYIMNSNVPDGVFAALLERWDATVHSRPDGFTFPALTAEERARGDLDFAALLATPQGRARFKVVGLFGGMVTPDEEFRFTTRAGSIDIAVSDAEHPSETYEMKVDWTPNGFQIVDVGEFILGC
jgi:hypothetical protein